MVFTTPFQDPNVIFTTRVEHFHIHFKYVVLPVPLRNTGGLNPDLQNNILLNQHLLAYTLLDIFPEFSYMHSVYTRHM